MLLAKEKRGGVIVGVDRGRRRGEEKLSASIWGYVGAWATVWKLPGLKKATGCYHASVHSIACRLGPIMLQPASPILVNRSSERSCMALTTSCTVQIWNSEQYFNRQILKFGSKSAPLPRKSFQRRQHGWKIALALDTSGIPDPGGQESPNGDIPGLGRTRLGSIVSSGGRQFLEKLNSARKNFPMKLFLLLLGFYTSNALATILGQTGDWDVLVAGVVVVAIEGIGMLMYRRPPTLPTRSLQSFVGLVNYWKAGVCLGLFVDAFKLGS